jgi:branched-chain amino acid transport system substrate-binding protein
MSFKITMIPLAGAIALAFAGSVAAQDMVVKIGHVAPVSGEISHLGKDNENGAKMAIEDLNAKGIVIGGKKVKFELLLEDDAADPKQGTAVAQKLVDAKVNGVIGHLNSGTTVPASKIYDKAGIVQISPSATLVEYTHQGFKGAFRVVANDGQLGGTMGRYAVEVKGAKKIAVIDDKTAYGEGVAKQFILGAKSKGAVIVDQQHTTKTSTDFNAILTSIRSKKPDLIFLGGFDSIGGPMLRQMKALGINAKFMGGDALCTTKLIELAADALGDEKVTCAEAGGILPAQKKARDDWDATYKKKFNLDVQIYAPYVYDAVMVMAQAMKDADSAEPAKYLPFLKKIQYKGITGDIAFDQFGDIKNGALTIYTYKGGKKEVVQVVK